MEDEKKKKFLEALGNVVEKNKSTQPYTGPGSDLNSRNLAKGTLDQDILSVEGGKLGRDLTPEKQIVRGGNPTIDTKQVAKTTNINNHHQMRKDLDLKQNLKASFKAAADAGDTVRMGQLRQIAKKFGSGLKALPLVGSLAGLMGAEDASAGIPILDSAESAGMSAGDENAMIADIKARVNANNSQSHADRQSALAKLIELNKNK